MFQTPPPVISLAEWIELRDQLYLFLMFALIASTKNNLHLCQQASVTDFSVSCGKAVALQTSIYMQALQEVEALQ